MSCTRPDLAYAVSKLSRYTSNPSSSHWNCVIRLLRYLRYTREYGLHYNGYDILQLSKDTVMRIGYLTRMIPEQQVGMYSHLEALLYRGNRLNKRLQLDPRWNQNSSPQIKRAKRQNGYVNLLRIYQDGHKPASAICIHCDSQSAIGRAHSTMHNGKNRHIRRRHNTVRQLISTGIITVDYVKSKDNIADPLTKGLSRELVQKSSMGMGLKPLKN